MVMDGTLQSTNNPSPCLLSNTAFCSEEKDCRANLVLSAIFSSLIARAPTRHELLIIEMICECEKHEKQINGTNEMKKRSPFWRFDTKMWRFL
jgi:hypothetical protein